MALGDLGESGAPSPCPEGHLVGIETQPYFVPLLSVCLVTGLASLCRGQSFGMDFGLLTATCSIQSARFGS